MKTTVAILCLLSLSFSMNVAALKLHPNAMDGYIPTDTCGYASNQWRCLAEKEQADQAAALFQMGLLPGQVMGSSQRLNYRYGNGPAATAQSHKLRARGNRR